MGRETEQHGTGGFAGRLDPISLSEVDEQAALRRRVDTKYVASRSAVWDMVDRLRQRYKVLEIDGRRCFDYESVYLDTPDLRCFRDHVEEVRPRFKIRTRLYRETGVCFLEVKVKDAADETTKRQCEYDPVDHGTLTQEGRRFVDEALGELAGREGPADLSATLSTRYRRVTLAAREGGERVTLDFDVELRAMDNRSRKLKEDLALAETKTEQSKGAFDEALVAVGCEPTAVSKYRLGVGLLLADDPDEAGKGSVRQGFAA